MSEPYKCKKCGSVEFYCHEWIKYSWYYNTETLEIASSDPIDQTEANLYFCVNCQKAVRKSTIMNEVSE